MLPEVSEGLSWGQERYEIFSPSQGRARSCKETAGGRFEFQDFLSVETYLSEGGCLQKWRILHHWKCAHHCGFSFP